MSLSTLEKTENKLSFIQDQVKLGALRWLHCIDLRDNSPTVGICDREYWSWKTKDFANGTHQGALAGFLDSKHLLDLDDGAIETIVSKVTQGSLSIQRSNGSYEEAYPLEGSWCVTALVVFNLLYAYFKYPNCFTPDSEKQLKQIVSQAHPFLLNQKESHGTIANHQATALMALLLSSKFLGANMDEEDLLAFADLQDHEEGWFTEYDGADPGYQTLLNYYLLAASEVIELPSYFEGMIEKSNHFLSSFCFPDGSFSGEIGSRGTSIVYPSGLWTLNNGEIKASNLIHWYLNSHLNYHGIVTPTNIDPGNFTPVLNSWAFALKWIEANQHELPQDTEYPQYTGIKYYPNAKLVCVSTPKARLVISQKNGVLRKVNCDANNSWADNSIVAWTSAEGYSTQLSLLEKWKQTNSAITFSLRARKPVFRQNTPFSTIVLRIMGSLLYPFPSLQRLLKSVLAHYVMKPNEKLHADKINVTIDLTSPNLDITWESPNAIWKPRAYGFDQHMASANTLETRAFVNEST